MIGLDEANRRIYPSAEHCWHTDEQSGPPQTKIQGSWEFASNQSRVDGAVLRYHDACSRLV